ncbi:FliH/SctL family protein [Acutalibacter sp. 1XD8-36]|uniref:FliH/SctL family protein n=1 Tax=Acutalibacter sp. 1XD8-36 TaxID=2320852 RepID=UPI0014125663|nr:FliH/SctL family protein [Acutalibacter sp. 1XD8-36]NBJ90281.1 F0F1 ATP synthase subunit delta [Acutalibacter sp. 1XD8-36]
MPGIFKRFTSVSADKYVFPDAEDLNIPGETAAEPLTLEEFTDSELPADTDTPEPRPKPEEPVKKKDPSPIDFAQIQADAILAEAQQEANELREKAMADLEAELGELRNQAHTEGYQAGFAEGMAEGRQEARLQLEQMAAEQEKEVAAFLKDAVRVRDQLLEDSKQDLKELALAIAEKVIHVSLKSSGDILIRMIESATAKRRRCEWVQVYIADRDARASANTVPELTEALSRLSDRVRVIPMTGDESGTCIIEMPDEIIDASVSTQLDNLRGLISDEPDRQGRP